jgi:hypothetical protein
MEQVETATFCAERYNKDSGSRAAQIEASYKLFHAGASGSEVQIKEDQDKKCGSKYGREYLSSLGISESEIVSPAAIDAVKTCFLVAQGFQLTRLASSTDSFSADFRYNGSGDIFFNGVDISGEENTPAASCKVRHKAQRNVTEPFKLASGTNVTVTCQRRIARSTQGGETYAVYPEGLVTVSSEAGSISIPLIRVSSFSAPETRLARIERDVASLNDAEREAKSRSKELSAVVEQLRGTISNKLSSVSAAMTGITFETDWGKDANMMCPPGQAMIGARFGAGNSDLKVMCGQLRLNSSKN